MTSAIKHRQALQLGQETRCNTSTELSRALILRKSRVRQAHRPSSCQTRDEPSLPYPPCLPLVEELGALPCWLPPPWAPAAVLGQSSGSARRTHPCCCKHPPGWESPALQLQASHWSCTNTHCRLDCVLGPSEAPCPAVSPLGWLETLKGGGRVLGLSHSSDTFPKESGWQRLAQSLPSST